MNEKLLKKLEIELDKIDCVRKNYDTKDYKESSLNFLGIPIPNLRKFKFSFLNGLNDIEKLEFLDYAFKNTNISEVRTWILIQCDKFDIDFLVKNKDVFLGWVGYAKCWWHSDGLSSFYSRILEIDRSLIQLFDEWNKSSDLWQRRHSVVGLYYYSSMRKNPIEYEVGIVYVENLLDDLEYYTQKGVGWTLRELYNLYPDKTTDFLFKNIKKIKPAALQASTEKLEKNVKLKLMEIRKVGK